MLKVPNADSQENGIPEEVSPLNLRKRQTILADNPHKSKSQPHRHPSRRASMHIRNRSLNKELPTPQQPVNLEDVSSLTSYLESTGSDDLLQQMEALKLKSEELEQNDIAAVRHNYETLVSVSRSIAELPPQIAKLRKQVGDLAAITDALKADAEVEAEETAASRSSAPRAPRASVMMLNSAWRQDLAALFRQVEGAQMFLPPIPGRHVLSDYSACYELNQVTWTNLKPVHIFVLSDHLLVAEKTSRSLTVDHCWPLQELSITKREDAVQVVSPQGRNVYKAKNLPALFRDIRRAQASQNSGSRSGNGHVRTHSRQPSEPNKRSSKVVAQEMEQARIQARELADIDLKLAQHDWSRATTAVIDSHIPGISERRTQLEAMLLERAKHGGEPLALLVKLGRAEDAIELYLAERAQLIERRVSEVTFRGDIVAHLSQVCVLYFQHIIATVRSYVSAFHSDAHSARVVSWTKQQIELYASMFNRQLFKIRPDSRIYSQCVEITRKESAQLKELGLDMNFLLDYVWAQS